MAPRKPAKPRQQDKRTSREGENDTPTSDQVIGERVRVLRSARGMTQEKLADAISARGVPMTQQSVHRVERGTRPLTLTEAEMLSRILHINVSDLAMMRTSDESLSASVWAMFDELRRKSELAESNLGEVTTAILYLDRMQEHYLIEAKSPAEGWSGDREWRWAYERGRSLSSLSRALKRVANCLDKEIEVIQELAPESLEYIPREIPGPTEHKPWKPEDDPDYAEDDQEEDSI